MLNGDFSLGLFSNDDGQIGGGAYFADRKRGDRASLEPRAHLTPILIDHTIIDVTIK